MIAFSDPDQVHEYLVILLLLVMFPTAFVAMAYMHKLGLFFDELKRKEPEVWEHIGKPGLANMLLLPFLRFRKYYSFLPALRERATHPDSEYRHARPAYRLLKAGLVLCGLLFVLVAVMIFWIIYHDL